MKRKLFLETFLGALGGVKIDWGEENFDEVYGTLIYDEDDLEERQDFVWHMSEKDVPSDDVIKLIQYIKENNLIYGDRITRKIYDSDLNFVDQSKQEEMVNALFKVEVTMIDNGEETDKFFIHS